MSNCNYSVNLDDGETIALILALRKSLASYESEGFSAKRAHPASVIAAQQNLLDGLEAIRLGDRRGSDKFEIVHKSVRA